MFCDWDHSQRRMATLEVLAHRERLRTHFGSEALWRDEVVYTDAPHATLSGHDQRPAAVSPSRRRILMSPKQTFMLVVVEGLSEPLSVPLPLDVLLAELVVGRFTQTHALSTDQQQHLMTSLYALC